MEGGNSTGCFCVRQCCDEHMSEGAGEDERLDAEEKDKTLSVTALVSSVDGVVIAGEDEDAQEDLPWNFDKDIGYDESRPAVYFGRAFADFVQRALGDEYRHDLLDHCGIDGGQHEDTEDHVL